MNKNILDLIEMFTKFPGIGPKQAERFARFIMTRDKTYINRLTRLIQDLNQNSKQCAKCYIHHNTDNELCEFCSDKSRLDKNLIIVEKDVDVYTIERSGITDSKYFVLNNLIPILSKESEDKSLERLERRIKDDSVENVVIALAVHPDADHTSEIIMSNIRKCNPKITVSKLGRGLSSGSEIEYSDPDTIKSAFKNRS